MKYLYTNTKAAGKLDLDTMPPPPPWRRFKGEILTVRHLEPDEKTCERGAVFEAGDMELEMVNAALYLRRPLLVTGRPGTGKSSLAYSVAFELGLGSVLYWPINTRSTLSEGLYEYDAIGRLQELQILVQHHQLGDRSVCGPDNFVPERIGRYIRLGPLGTALLAAEKPRVLLIDEIDKSDIDLPNDLLNVFEEGRFRIRELSRLADLCPEVEVLPHDGGDPVRIKDGRVQCRAFPLIIMTSNAERELPAPFMRRCLRLDIPEPSREKLSSIVRSHFKDAGEDELKAREDLIELFFSRRQVSELATDQLLNAVHMTLRGVDVKNRESLIKNLFMPLDQGET